MAGYTRQETWTTDDTILAAHGNNEFNAVVAAFHVNTGHKHDGTAAEGPVIALIGDAGSSTPLNKVLVDSDNNNIGFWINVSSSAVEQVIIQDGAILPVTDNDIDLGSATKQFKNLYLEGAIVGTFALDSGTTIGTLTLADGSITDSGGSISFGNENLSTTGTLTASGGGALTGTWSNLGTVTTVDINGGTIDGAVIGGSSAAAGSFTTLTASGALSSGNHTFTTANPDILGNDADGRLIVSAGTASNSGANLSLYGPSHATNAYDLLFRVDGTNRLLYDHSATQWDFTGAVTISSTLAAGATTVTGGITSTTGSAFATSSGNVGIGIASGSADGKLHVHAASAGTITASPEAATFVVENSGNGGISILVPDASTASLVFGTPSDDLGARVAWSLAANTLFMGSRSSGGSVVLHSGDNVTNLTLSGASGSELASFAGKAIVGSTSVTPDGTLHVHTATAGTVTAENVADDFVIENNSSGGMTIVTPDASTGNIYWSTPSDSIAAGIANTYSTGLFTLFSHKVGATMRFSADDNVPNLTLSGASGSEIAQFTGSIGVGISPQRLLHLYNTTEATSWAQSTTGIALHRTTNTSGDFYFGIDNSTGSGFGLGNYARLIYSTSSYPIIFATNATTALTLDSSQNATFAGDVTLSEGKVSITDTANEIALHVITSATSASGVAITGDSATSAPTLNVSSNSSSTGTRTVAQIKNDNTLAVNATVLTLQQDAAQTALSIDQNGNGVALIIDSESTTNYVANIAAPTSAPLLYLANQHATTPRGIQLDFTGGSPDDNTAYFIYGKDTTADRFLVYSDGDVQNHDNSYGAISDARLKQDITPVNSFWDKYKQVEWVEYKHKTDVEQYGEDAKEQLGVIAQDLREVFPSIIKQSDEPFINDEGEEEEGEMGVKYSVLYAIQGKVLQEAMARIEELEAKVEALS